MIYTVTFSPSVDYVIHIDNIKTGIVNRTENEEIYFGGKGINVSLVLAELGVESTALGFVAGFTGDAIENHLKNAGIRTDFVHLDSGFSRINVKIKSGGETEINGQGADIPQDKLNEFFKKIDMLNHGDMLVLSGNIPKSLPDDIYGQILERIEKNDKYVRTFVDASGNLLLNTLKYEPFLIKPNQAELEGIFGKKLSNVAEVLECAVKLREMGAKSVLVSRAEKSAVFINEHGKVLICNSCIGKLKNSVGAGDSTIAGFIAGLITDCKCHSYDYALKLGLATGSATAFSDGLAKKDDVFRLFDKFYG